MRVLGIAGKFRSTVVAVCLFLLVCLAHVSAAYAVNPCSSPANAIVAENCLPGNPSSEWDIGPNTSGDPTIQGFATDISVNQGGTIGFKIKTDAKAYTMNIYRLGYYGGLGARKVATITPSVPLPQTQPACLSDTSTGLTDCGNWAVTATWQVPATATSGVYIVHLQRTDTGGESHIVFIVRNDSAHSAILYQTGDEAWQAYNYYGNGSLYGPGQPRYDLTIRAYKVSYNRPFLTRGFGIESDTWLFGPEYPMIEWLEQNGYDVAYFTGVDAARYGSLIKNHKIYMDSGHDEYWSGPHRANVQAARDAGVNMAFFSGNEVFWKTRWENSIDGTNTPYRTLVCYKETLAFAKIDPSDPPTWTGTWRDKSFSPPADGGNPENSLTGTIFEVNGIGSDNDGSMRIQVPYVDSRMRLWRNTAIASLATGGTYNMPPGTLGYEWDVDMDNGARPAGLFDLSSSTHSLTADYLLDQGATYGAGTATHHITEYRASSGALVFGGGTIDWSWGLSSNHDNPFSFTTPSADPNMQQATVNLFADMGVQPGSMQSGLVPATASTDTTAPVSHISTPASGTTVNTGSAITVSGTASDVGGVVAGVEVSGDGGSTWHPANGHGSWTYTWNPTVTGQTTLLSRAVDDSANLEAAHGIPVNVVPQVCPCSVWNNTAVPTSIDSGDSNSVELGLKFRADSDGSVLGVRFYKASLNNGKHVGHLWTSTGTLLGSVTFTSETSSGWQQVNFAQPIPVVANTTYVVSYFAPSGHYSADQFTFSQSGVDNPPLHALANGVDGANAVYVYTSTPGVFPTNSFSSTNYWVDVVYTSSSTYAVSGNITGTGGSGTPVALTGPQTVSTSTDTSGNFQFDGITDGSYTVTPSRSGVSFTPTNKSVTVNNSSVSGVNFTATVTNPLSISGTLTNGAGASVNLSGAANLTATADASGNYIFNGLLSGSYLVTPSKANILFTPSQQQVNLTTTSATLVNFQGQTCVCISLWQPSTSPVVVDAKDGSAVELGLKFRSDMSGVVTGVRFYKATTNTGTHVGHLWSSTGTLLASVTFTGESASGWQQATFSSPVTIAPNTTYIVSYYAPVGHYSADSGYFTSQGFDNAPLHALANTVSADGVYLYTKTTTGGFPTNTYSSTNYWVDVLFAAAQSYHVSGTIAGANGPNATVSLTGATTVTTTADSTGKFTFSGVNPGTYSVTPTSAVGFSPGNQTVIVSSGDVTNVNFSTLSACPCISVWSASTAPKTIDAQELNPVEVGTRFTSDNDGYILGVRFYKAPANTGQHVVNLWSPAGSGSLLATATIAASTESPSGWQQIMFAQPIPVSASTGYIASYFAPNGHYSGDGAFFATAGVDHAPLHAPANTASAPNGVFGYGTKSVYPSSTYNSSNYWVDVLYASATQYAIGGKISGAPAGTVVTLSGAASASTTADAAGNYNFVNLAPGTYTVTPSASGTVFTPASQTVTLGSAHALGVNFTASAVTYSISGTVSGAPNDSVVLSGSASQTTTTNASGSFTFSGVGNGSYTVTPGASGLVISPSSQPVTVNGANVSSVNFTAAAQTYTVSGVITGGAGTTITLAGGAGGSTTADASGSFSFTGLTSGSYLLTPSKAGAVFTPTTLSVSVQGASVTNANFTVPSNCPCDTIWQPATVPAMIDAADPTSGEYGVKFRADADGYVSGVRFYKATTNSGTHVGNLWTSTGQLLGSATFASESASGWQQVFFAAPVPVKANTTYVASYFAPVGHYSANSGYFTSGGVDNAPLHALANGVDGQNAVYAYGAGSTYPINSYNAANYWADVVFLPTSTYTVAGTISGAGGLGATVTLTGATTLTTTANTSDNFSFNGLSNGTYTLAVTNTGHTFTPSSQTVTVNNGHVLGIAITSN